MKANEALKDPALLETAWQWVYRLRESDVSQQELSDWLAWCDGDARHKAAFEYMQSLFEQTDRVAEGPRALSADLWLSDAPVEAKPRERPVLRRRNGWAWAAAAAVAGIAVAVTLQFGGSEALPGLMAQRPVELPAAAVPVRESFLADGSHVEMAPKTELSVEMTERQRTIVMQQGAAYFTVAHNKERPFIVRAGKFNVRAVGTAFNVRSAAGRVVVTVAEGTVDVYPSDSQASVRATAGTEIAWSMKGGGPLVTSVDPAHALAWKQGSLDYINEPLEAVVADLNRYSRRPIVIRDPAVGELQITGTVRTDDAEKWLEALPGMFDVELHTDASGNLVLARRPAGES